MKPSGVSIIDGILGGVVPGLPLVVLGPAGSGRTVLALQLVHAALARGERAAMLTSEPPDLLLRQARTLELEVETGLREGRFALLELDSLAGARVRVHGPDALIEALRAEMEAPDLLVVDPLQALTEEILEEATARSFLRELLCSDVPGAFSYASVDGTRIETDPMLFRTLADLAGTLVRLDRDAQGGRSFAVEKSRERTAVSGTVAVRIGGGGLAWDGEPGGAEPRAASAAAHATAASAASRERPRLLIVEDDRFQRERCDDILGELYELDFAGDGFEAIARVLSEPPDLILLDLMLPRVGGLEVLRSLQAAGSTVPVIVTSGTLGRTTDRVRALFLGATDVMPKPLQPLELRHKVATLLRLPRGEPPAPGPSDPDVLLADSGSRVLDEPAFAERVARASRVGEAHGVESCLVAVEAPGEEALDAFVACADEVLRRDDAIGLVAPGRVLVLLLFTMPKDAAIPLARLRDALDRRQLDAETLRLGVGLATADDALKDRFDSLEPWAPEVA